MRIEAKLSINLFTITQRKNHKLTIKVVFLKAGTGKDYVASIEDTQVDNVTYSQ
jgi:hypothetical protein